MIFRHSKSSPHPIHPIHPPKAPAMGNSLQLVIARVAEAAISPRAPTIPATPAPHSAPTLGKVSPGTHGRCLKQFKCVKLVGGWPTPLKNMSQWEGYGRIIPCIMGNNKCLKPPTSKVLNEAGLNYMIYMRIRWFWKCVACTSPYETARYV